MKNIDSLIDVPVVLVTADVSTEIAETAAGVCSGLIHKPVSRLALFKEIDKVLNS